LWPSRQKQGEPAAGSAAKFSRAGLNRPPLLTGGRESYDDLARGVGPGMAPGPEKAKGYREIAL